MSHTFALTVAAPTPFTGPDISIVNDKHFLWELINCHQGSEDARSVSIFQSLFTKTQVAHKSGTKKNEDGAVASFR